jgi:hypothetical protein
MRAGKLRIYCKIADRISSAAALSLTGVFTTSVTSPDERCQ